MCVRILASHVKYFRTGPQRSPAVVQSPPPPPPPPPPPQQSSSAATCSLAWTRDVTRCTGSRPAVVRLYTHTAVRGFRAAPLFRRVSPTAALPDHREITEHVLNILYHR